MDYDSVWLLTTFYFWDRRPLGLTGNKVEKLWDLSNITVNTNVVFGDSSALAPGGIRIGAPAMTSRGLFEKDSEQITEFLHQAVPLCLSIQKEHRKLLKDFNKGSVNNKDIEELEVAVKEFGVRPYAIGVMLGSTLPSPSISPDILFGI